jgi:hypothetical protein
LYQKGRGIGSFRNNGYCLPNYVTSLTPLNFKMFLLTAVTTRAVFTHGPKGPGPGPGRQISTRGIFKKIEIEVWYVGKKRLSTREKFKGDLY